jgi:YVTN family beta-propeller protein
MPRESLIAIDISTGNIIRELKIEPRAVKVSNDGSKVYVFSPASERSEAKLLIIDSNSLDIIRTINLGKTGSLSVGPIAAYKIILNRAESIAYINYETEGKDYQPPKWTDPDDTGLVAIDLVSERVIARIFYSDRPDINAKGMALTPDETTLLVSDPFSQSVVVIDTSTNKVIDRIAVGYNPSAIKLSGDGKRAYVLQQLGNTQMTVIEVDTHKVLKNMDKYYYGVHARCDFEISADERYAYISNFDTNILSFYDLRESRVVKIIDTGLDPVQMAATPDMHYLYVNAVTSDEIYVIDTTSNSLIKIIKLGDP